MADRRLEQAFRKVWEAAIGPEGATQRQSVGAVINEDNTVNPDALLGVLPWSRMDAFIPGTLTVGPGRGGRYAMPQGARMRHIALSARVAPTSAPLTLQLTGGNRTETVSIPVGQTSTATGLDITVPPGGAITIDVLGTGGAQDVTISLHYTAGGA